MRFSLIEPNDMVSCDSVSFYILYIATTEFQVTKKQTVFPFIHSYM